MARGWESKAIESQQEEAARRPRAGRAQTAEERVAASAQRTLELTRAKIQGDFDRATSATHRAMLRRALDDLDRRLDQARGGPAK
jgi:hypothetical protein